MSATFTINPGALPQINRTLLVPLAEGGARIVVDEIKSYMEDAPPRTGRTYLVPGTSVPYTASAPGEPPAVRTGAYRDSWEATKGVDLGDKVVAAAVSGLLDDEGDPLGLSLEFGRESAATIAAGGVRAEGLSGSVRPRPHVRPGVEAAKPKILAMLRRSRGTA